MIGPELPASQHRLFRMIVLFTLFIERHLCTTAQISFSAVVGQVLRPGDDLILVPVTWYQTQYAYAGRSEHTSTGTLELTNRFLQQQGQVPSVHGAKTTLQSYVLLQSTMQLNVAV
jgi:hypothetical protein